MNSPSTNRRPGGRAVAMSPMSDMKVSAQASITGSVLDRSAAADPVRRTGPRLPVAVDPHLEAVVETRELASQRAVREGDRRRGGGVLVDPVLGDVERRQHLEDDRAAWRTVTRRVSKDRPSRVRSTSRTTSTSGRAAADEVGVEGLGQLVGFDRGGGRRQTLRGDQPAEQAAVVRPRRRHGEHVPVPFELQQLGDPARVVVVGHRAHPLRSGLVQSSWRLDQRGARARGRARSSLRNGGGIAGSRPLGADDARRDGVGGTARVALVRRARRQRQPLAARAAEPRARRRRRRRAAREQPAELRRDASTPASAPGSASRRSTGTSPATRPRYIVDDCEAKALVTDRRARVRGRSVPGRGAGVQGRARRRRDDRRVRVARGGARRRSVRAASTDPAPGTTMLYTSGTTGRPKGVHRPPAAAPAATVNLFGYDEAGGDRAPVHRAAVPRRAAGVLAGHARSPSARPSC